MLSLVIKGNKLFIKRPYKFVANSRYSESVEVVVKRDESPIFGDVNVIFKHKDDDIQYSGLVSSQSHLVFVPHEVLKEGIIEISCYIQHSITTSSVRTTNIVEVECLPTLYPESEV